MVDSRHPLDLFVCNKKWLVKIRGLPTPFTYRTVLYVCRSYSAYILTGPEHPHLGSSKNRQVKGRKEPVMVYEAWFLWQIFSLFQMVVLESLDGNFAI